jgi:hypothetical protein
VSAAARAAQRHVLDAVAASAVRAATSSASWIGIFQADFAVFPVRLVSAEVADDGAARGGVSGNVNGGGAITAGWGYEQPAAPCGDVVAHRGKAGALNAAIAAAGAAAGRCVRLRMLPQVVVQRLLTARGRAAGSASSSGADEDSGATEDDDDRMPGAVTQLLTSPGTSSSLVRY